VAAELIVRDPRGARGQEQRNRAQAEHAVIHEMLHTLGLGQDPPTPSEITRRVRRLCGNVVRRASR
jgi:hypothetical protein